jgi:hypothetical protein
MLIELRAYIRNFGWDHDPPITGRSRLQLTPSRKDRI